MLRSDTTSLNWHKFNCFHDAKIPIIRNFLVKLGNVKNSDNQKLMYLTTWDREFEHFWVKIFQNRAIGFVKFYSLGHGQCISFLLSHSSFHLHFFKVWHDILFQHRFQGKNDCLWLLMAAILTLTMPSYFSLSFTSFQLNIL